MNNPIYKVFFSFLLSFTFLDASQTPFRISTWRGPSPLTLNRNSVWPGWKTLEQAGFNTIGPLRAHSVHSVGYRWEKILKEIEAESALKIVVVDPVIQLLPNLNQLKDWNSVAKRMRRDFAAYPNIDSFFIIDEPWPAEIPAVKTASEAFLEQGLKPFVNLLPAIKNFPYQDYLSKYMGTVNPSSLSFDYYMLMSDGSLRPRVFENYRMIAEAAQEKKIPAYSIIQLKGWDDKRLPNRQELYWQAMLSMAYGMDGITYFHIMKSPIKPHLHGGIIDEEGTPFQPQYDIVSKLNKRLSALYPYLLDFEYQGVWFTAPVPTHEKGVENLVTPFQWQVERRALISKLTTEHQSLWAVLPSDPNEKTKVMIKDLSRCPAAEVISNNLLKKATVKDGQTFEVTSDQPFFLFCEHL